MNQRTDPAISGLFDAHLHLQDPRLQAIHTKKESGRAVTPDYSTANGQPIAGQVSNGTHPEDWPMVRTLQGEGIHKAYGVHPWKVDALEDGWESRLEKYLESGAVSVGEIGLDRWIEPRNEDLQVEIFERQLVLAANLKLPPTIHCVRAWGMLVDCLQRVSLPKGFLVHGFGGSREVLYQLLDLGAYVSFSAYAADPVRHRMREAARACPVDRLLVETDAPDMVPPENICLYPVNDTKGRIHHPSEVWTAYGFLTELRNEKLDRFAMQIEDNFKNLFLKENLANR